MITKFNILESFIEPNPDIKILIGKTISEITRFSDGDELKFKCNDGTVFKYYHNQNCCESVEIEDICGDFNDLIGSPILIAEKRVDDSESSTSVEVSKTWTFYEFATIKGSVTIRWYGSSNGYYSEEVDLDIYYDVIRRNIITSSPNSYEYDFEQGEVTVMNDVVAVALKLANWHQLSNQEIMGCHSFLRSDLRTRTIWHDCKNSV